jgi:hypothetical protein
MAAGLVIAGLALGLGACVFEWFNQAPGESPWAQRGMILLFAAVHLVVGGILTVYRRTAT